MEVGLSLFRYFELGLRVCDIVVKKFTFAISSPVNTSYNPTSFYLSELIAHYLPSRYLHSSNPNLMARPYGTTSNFSSRAFSVSAPSTWNSLPEYIRRIDKLPTVKRQISSIPVCFFPLVTLCQHFRFVLRFLALAYMYVY